MTDRTLNYGDWCEVYWNLHEHVFSVRRGGLVVARLTDLALGGGVLFVSQDAGRARVRRQGRKNVHAFIRGYFAPTGVVQPGTKHVSYDPYVDDSFVRVLDNGGRVPIFDASNALLTTTTTPEGDRSPRVLVP